ncbi:MAG: radical SAM protein [Candidatus Bathyarchaeota archaeon]
MTHWLKKNYKKSIRVDTNGQGYLLNNGRDVIKELKEAGIDKIRVSLNAHDKETYNEICNPNFDDAYEKILDFIKKSIEEDIDTEVTAVTIPEVELMKVREMVERMGAKFSTRQYIQFFW